MEEAKIIKSGMMPEREGAKRQPGGKGGGGGEGGLMCLREARVPIRKRLGNEIPLRT